MVVEPNSAGMEWMGLKIDGVLFHFFFVVRCAEAPELGSTVFLAREGSI